MAKALSLIMLIWSISIKLWCNVKFKTLLASFLVVILCSWVWIGTICSGPKSNSAIIEIEEGSFNGYLTARNYRIVEGKISNSLYFLHVLSTSVYSSAVRKVDPSGVQTWLTSFVFDTNVKSLSVDATEKYVFLNAAVSPLTIVILSANNGVILNQHV